MCEYCRGVIPKGSYFMGAVYKTAIIYAFRTHIDCFKIADKLKMYDGLEEGLDNETFSECIFLEYEKITGKGSMNVPFKECLQIVLDHYNKESLEDGNVR